MRPRHGLFLAVAGLALLAAACGDDDRDTRAETSRPPSLEALEAHEWVLDVDASTPALADADGSVTLSVTEDEISGTGPCNGFRAGFSIDGGDVEVTAIARTLRLCDGAVEQADADYFAALESVDTATFEDDEQERLVLAGEGVSLIYDAVDADELIVGEWHVTSISTGDAIVSVPAGVDPVLVFGRDGSLGVTGLCNTIGSSWELDGDHLEIAPARSTAMACESTELMETEAAIGAALDRVDTVAVTPDSMTAFDEDGLIVFDARTDSN
jgi:heat shock protein HslJ